MKDPRKTFWRIWRSFRSKIRDAGTCHSAGIRDCQENEDVHTSHNNDRHNLLPFASKQLKNVR